jgi:hypothetical protein
VAKSQAPLANSLIKSAGFFTDKPIGLGPLTGSAYAGGSLSLDITLTVTSDAAGSGFYGGIIVTG